MLETAPSQNRFLLKIFLPPNISKELISSSDTVVSKQSFVVQLVERPTLTVEPPMEEVRIQQAVFKIFYFDFFSDFLFLPS